MGVGPSVRLRMGGRRSAAGTGDQDNEHQDAEHHKAHQDGPDDAQHQPGGQGAAVAPAPGGSRHLPPSLGRQIPGHRAEQLEEEQSDQAQHKGDGRVRVVRGGRWPTVAEVVAHGVVDHRGPGRLLWGVTGGGVALVEVMGTDAVGQSGGLSKAGLIGARGVAGRLRGRGLGLGVVRQGSLARWVAGRGLDVVRLGSLARWVAGLGLGVVRRWGRRLDAKGPGGATVARRGELDRRIGRPRTRPRLVDEGFFCEGQLLGGRIAGVRHEGNGGLAGFVGRAGVGLGHLYLWLAGARVPTTVPGLAPLVRFGVVWPGRGPCDLA